METEGFINLDDFKKTEITIGEILTVEKIEGTDKLLKLSVDFGEDKPRQIISGIAEFFPEPHVLVRQKCAFVTNLPPRVIRGFESQGMILAAKTEEGRLSLLEVSYYVPAGTRVN